MHDTLEYFSHEPVHRRFHHHELTFSLVYAFSENFVLPLSHDEVVHGKRSLLEKMPGDRWQQFANLRALYGYMWAHPGKQLLFMGGELGAGARVGPRHVRSTGTCSNAPSTPACYALVRDLNRSLSGRACAVGARLRRPRVRLARGRRRRRTTSSPSRAAPPTACAGSSVSPTCRRSRGTRTGSGFPQAGRWREVLNTDSRHYGGSDVGNIGSVEVVSGAWHGQEFSAPVTLPPLAVVWFVPDGGGGSRSGAEGNP